METLLAAAGLTYPQIDPILLDLGFLKIRWYSLAYLGGLFFAWWFIRRTSQKPGAPMSMEHIDDFFFWGAMGVIIGGRLGYVLFYNLPFYLDNPLSIFMLGDGGMSFHGGLIGVVVAVIFFSRKHKLDLMRVADIVAIVSPIGLLLGRTANFINGELYGRVTDSPFGMVFPSDPLQVSRHPSQLYEAVLEGLVLFLILQLLYHFTNLKRRAGIIAGCFFIGYGLSRYTVEFFREPDAHLGLSTMLGFEISRGQLLTIPMFIFAAWLISKGLRRKLD